jgi:BolA protein
MNMRQTITEKLHEAFSPESLDVQDVSQAFKGKSRIDRHRMINATLASELAGSVHALAIHAQAPGEGGR